MRARKGDNRAVGLSTLLAAELLPDVGGNVVTAGAPRTPPTRCSAG